MAKERSTVYLRLSPRMAEEIRAAATARGWTINRWAEMTFQDALSREPIRPLATTAAATAPVETPPPETEEGEPWFPTFSAPPPSKVRR